MQLSPIFARAKSFIEASQIAYIYFNSIRLFDDAETDVFFDRRTEIGQDLVQSGLYKYAGYTALYSNQGDDDTLTIVEDLTDKTVLFAITNEFLTQN